MIVFLPAMQPWSLVTYIMLVLAMAGTRTSGERVYNATVSKNALDAYRTLMEALASAPAYSKEKYYIHVEAGSYVECVQVWKNRTNIVLIGDGAPTTKIQWNRDGRSYKTYDTATFVVMGDGFTAMFIAFENTAGDGSQAVAVMTIANNVAYYRCTFLGYQDTVYAKSGIQFYRECDIYGTVDFIFGDAVAVFQTCKLYARLPKIITFTAQKRADSHGGSGFVIQNCTLTVAPGLELQKPKFEGYLGRPWANYSTVVVMESYLDSIIRLDGWLEWPPRDTKNVVYVEFDNRGPGANTKQRVNWTGYQDVTGHPEKVQRFVVGEFVNQENWLGRTGIPYSNGFIYH